MTANWRWLLHDPQGTLADVRMEHNPNKITGVLPTQPTTSASIGPDGGIMLLGTPKLPVEWTFSGVLETQALHDHIEQFLFCQNRIVLTDHLQRSWWVTLKTFAPVRVQSRNKWRHTYTVTGLIFGRV